jgi:hypothetical protein
LSVIMRAPSASSAPQSGEPSLRCGILRRAAGTALAVVLALTALTPMGCETEKSYAEEQAAKRAMPKAAPVLVVRHRVGGTHHQVIVRGDVAFVTYANSLLTISTGTGTVLSSIELLPFGTSGAVVHLVEVPDREELLAVLDGTAVLRIVIADPAMPEVIATRRAQEIGFAPRAVSSAGGEIWISGDGGIVPWSKVAPPFLWSSPEERVAVEKARAAYAPPAPFLAEQARDGGRGSVGPVVQSAEGLVAPIGRRVYALESARFVGAASRLEPIASATAAPLSGGNPLFAFILQSPQGAQVGLMGADVREIDSRAVPGTVRRVTVLHNILFAINDNDIIAFAISRGAEGLTLGEPVFIAVRGARDIDAITDNEFAVVGSFGRAMYRMRGDGRGEGDTFFRASREPSRLTHATTDRRRILAGGEEGSWLYTIGDEVALVNQPVPIESGSRMSAAGGWGRATVAADQRSVTVRPTVAAPPPREGEAKQPATNASGEILWTPNTNGAVYGVESFDGKLWIWHEDGIDVLGIEGGLLRPLGAFRVEGPVRYLFPQRVGGAVAYVSEFGGFGVLDFIERDALPSTGGERLVDVDADGNADVVLTQAEIDGAAMSLTTPRINVPTGRDRNDIEVPSRKN